MEFEKRKDVFDLLGEGEGPDSYDRPCGLLADRHVNAPDS